MSETLSMHETAELVGVSYEHFRKEWRTWRREQSFPSPALSRHRHRWFRPAVLGWLSDNSRPRAGRPPAPAGDAKADPWKLYEHLRAPAR